MITQTQAPERVDPAVPGFELRTFLRAFAVPLAITALVGLGAVAGSSALVEGATGQPAAGVRLEVGWGYVAMAPVTNVLDTLSVLTVGQHYAVLATLLLVYAAWRLVRTRRRLGVARRVAVELGVAVASLLGLVAFYAYGAVAPRPMAALVAEDEDVVIVDVHSHTYHSHDARSDWTAEDNRAWHAGAGFDAVYVSDHRTYQGFLDGVGANPSRAGDGTVLLSALEIKFAGKYASALGEAWRYRPAMDGNDLIEDSIYAVYRRTGIRPTFVFTIPSGTDDVVASTPDTLGYVALELNDAAPRGLRQSRRDRELLLRMADSLDLALVAASNNHGWGRTSAAWTLMRVPGWRAMSPDQLSAAIERKLHAERREASRVVERHTPWSDDSPAALATTVPAITWAMFGGIGAGERISWLLWSWLIAFAVAFRRGRLRAAPAHASPVREPDF